MTVRASTPSTRITRLSGRTVKPFVQAEEAVLILTRGDCADCAASLAAAEALLGARIGAGTAVGALVLDRPSAARFRCDNPWIGGLQVFPYVVVYRNGRRVAGGAASRDSGLLDRLAAQPTVLVDRAA